MSFDPNLPSPSAVAMARSVRATRVGKALANIEAGLDLIESSYGPSAAPLGSLGGPSGHVHSAGSGQALSGNEEHAVLAILAHLQERIKELAGHKRSSRANR
jgi:hypothetical protein